MNIEALKGKPVYVWKKYKYQTSHDMEMQGKIIKVFKPYQPYPKEFINSIKHPTFIKIFDYNTRYYRLLVETFTSTKKKQYVTLNKTNFDKFNIYTGPRHPNTEITPDMVGLPEIPTFAERLKTFKSVCNRGFSK